MFYWNQANFEGLRAIGEALRVRPGYAPMAEYCLLREQGLKKPAFSALQQFIVQMQQLPLSVQRQMACELARLHAENRAVHQLIAQPLHAYLCNVLHAWCAEEPAEAAPYRWLGLLGRETHCFESALRFDPDDHIALSWLASQALNAVDFITHHIGESRLLGSSAQAHEQLDTAVAYACRLPESAARAQFLAEAGDYRNLLDAWDTYAEAVSDMEFPDWCRQHGHAFEFGKAYYYDAQG